MFNRQYVKLFLIFVPFLLLIGIVVLVTTTRKNLPAISCASGGSLSGLYDVGSGVAIYNRREMIVPGELAYETDGVDVLGTLNSSDRWVEIDLSEQKLKAWNGGSLFLETAISTGLPWYPTPKGEFNIWAKLRYTKMEGGSGKNYYYLPNVPYVMYFENEQVPGWRGYGLHGTYWHNDFGTPRSHGCVNLPTATAEKLYYWVTPDLPAGKSSVFANNENTGTKIVIHE